MFELHNVTKKFGDEYALRNISTQLGGGLSFLVGASGSGKTTLLRILSGMEPDFEGEVTFCGNNLKSIDTKEKSRLYNDVFGFIWQDFNLLDDRTVMENILLPGYLKDTLHEKKGLSILRELKIANLADQKVGKLSGGQKQRVAIARELMKEPKVIFADEPTSALDQASSKEIMDILRKLSKQRAVIVVTHDTSLIREGDAVLELDKGELVSKTADESKPIFQPSKRTVALSSGSAFSLARTSIRRQFGRSAVSVLSVLLAAVLLLVPFSGAIANTSQSAFDELIETYGNNLFDIILFSQFYGAGSMNGKEPDEPQADVSQNIKGVFAKYHGDPRVDYILCPQTFGNITIQMDGRDYEVESTRTNPHFNGLLEGDMPMYNEMEMVVPEAFVKQMGVDNKDVIGKEVTFSATVSNRQDGQRVETPVSCTVKITGVFDTKMTVNVRGQITEYDITDSFFFSPKAIDYIKETFHIEGEADYYMMHCSDPEGMISIRDELYADGIVPLGNFELVEDTLRLNQQSNQQSGTATWVLGVLALVMILAVALLTAVLRRREFAIEGISGFAGGHFAKMIAAETIFQAAAAAALFLITSPLWNLGTTALWELRILTPKLLSAGVGMCVLLSALYFAVTAAIAVTTKTQKLLRTGDR